MPSEDYASVPSSGKLKLKGVKDSKISKKKKKTKKDDKTSDGFEDRSVVLKQLEDEDRKVEKSKDRAEKGKELEQIQTSDEPAEAENNEAGQAKTEAELRHEEQRRRRVSALVSSHHLSPLKNS